MDVVDLVLPQWPPLRHIKRGWQALSLQERSEVRRRIDDVMAAHAWPDGLDRKTLRRFFSFLAQVETIAIEIPLRFLPVADAKVQPLLRQQLVDEVFHSTLFARLAHELGPNGPDEPLASAERLLDRIRAEKDMAISATLLNLVAEGWIETIFKHAVKWGIAPAVFEAVLEDESRHVHEARDYLVDFDPQGAKQAVHDFEQGLIEVGAEPTVGLSMLGLAGDRAYQELIHDLQKQHREHLAEVGLEPSEAWAAVEEMAADGLLIADDEARPEPVEDTPWRKAARRVWQTPRDPTMQGDFEVRAGHIPKKLLTPVIVAAIGQAWQEHPRLNRIVHGDQIYQLPHCNVGVRVLIAEDELATVVITHADKRSVRDIARMLKDGVQQLQAVRKHRMDAGIEAPDMPDDVMAMAPPRPEAFSVALSNPGKFGIESGAGSFSGAVTPSTDVTVGRRRRLPVWSGIAYVPAWHVNFGCLQDHRVFDGREAGMAMEALRHTMSRKNVRKIMRRPDTLTEETADVDYAKLPELMPDSMRFLPVAGFYKYWPVVVGGAGLAILGGVGGFLLYTHVAAMSAAAAAAAAGGDDGDQQQQQQVVIETGDAASDGPVIDPFLPDGRPRCRAIKADGSQCGFHGKHQGFCGTHQ